MRETLLDTVLRQYHTYNFADFTIKDVQAALAKEHLTYFDFAALLSPAAQRCLEGMAQRAKRLTAYHFGNSVGLYTPLYISNYCVNYCVYCGFNCYNNIDRGKLTEEEIEQELSFIAQTGLREILILTGESRQHAPVQYIGQAIELAKKYFSTIGIEIYPLQIDEYAYLHQKGADFVSVYQETYDQKRYQEVHLAGPKCDFAYRFHAQERALMAGMRGVSVGALLGLGDFRRDAWAAGIHARALQKKYPHAEVGFSVPRLRPYKNNGENSPRDVNERQLLQVILAYRLFMPFASISISTRERDGFRDCIIGLAATKISAGVKTSVGGHQSSAKGDAQFDICDSRSVEEIEAAILGRGLQPVYTDYLRL
ncbi:MAG: 2-iminoacetate synthase ThiH [Bacillota bacterium]|jgi:2-iminoacetate synthase